MSVSLAYRLNTGTTGISTTTTNNVGRYRFLGIAPGVYTITEQSQALSPLTAYLDGEEQPGSLPATLTDDVFAGIIISTGQTASGFNFGELNPNTLQAFVFHDRDRDHAFSYQPDATLVGVTFVLTGADDRGPVGPITQTSDGSGYAYFQRLRPGTYAPG